MSKNNDPGCVVCGDPIPISRLKYGAITCSKECGKENRRKKKREYYEANREKWREYYEANREKRREYYEANREKKREYYEANREKRREYAKRWREANPEYYTQYYEANREKRREYAKQYYEANREKKHEYDKKRYEQAYVELSRIADISIDDLKAYISPMFIERELACWDNGSYFLDFILPVQERAGGKCELTGKKSSNLVVHHLDGYNWCIEGRVDPDNAVCIDKAVHKAFHDKYGRGDNTREQWEEFVANYRNKTVTLDDFK